MSRKSGKRARNSVKESRTPRTISVKRLGSALFVTLSLIATLITLFTLWPRPIVTVSAPVDPSNTMSAQFDVVNGGFVQLRYVGAALALGRIRLGSGILQGTNFETRLVRPIWRGYTLNMDERFTMTLSDLFYRASDADIEIVVDYQPWMVPVHRQKTFRFVTHRQTNGRLYWYALPSA